MRVLFFAKSKRNMMCWRDEEGRRGDANACAFFCEIKKEHDVLERGEMKGEEEGRQECVLN